jgi:SAM-dependent methyltransferase
MKLAAFMVMSVMDAYWYSGAFYTPPIKTNLYVGKRVVSTTSNRINVCLNKDPRVLLNLKERYPDSILLEGKIQDTIFNPATFDNVFLDFPLMLSPYKNEICAQALRILRPGGKVLFRDYHDSHPYLRELSELSDSQLKKIHKDLFSHHKLLRQLGMTSKRLFQFPYVHYIYERVPSKSLVSR